MPLLRVEDLKIHYPIKSGIFSRQTGRIRAIDGINFTICARGSLAIVGKSGAGKSTIGRALVGLEQVTSGQIIYAGRNMIQATNRRLTDYEKAIQLISKDEFNFVGRHMLVLDYIASPLRNFCNLSVTAEKARVMELLSVVELSSDTAAKSLAQLNESELCRVLIARALTRAPKLLIIDGLITSLDAFAQRQILRILQGMQRETQLSWLMLTNDLSLAILMCGQIAMLDAGRFVELGTSGDIRNHASHIYTRRMLAANPPADPTQREQLKKYRCALEREFTANQVTRAHLSAANLPLQQLSSTHFVAIPDK